MHVEPSGMRGGYGSLIVGNAAAYAVAHGLYEDEIEGGALYDLVRELIFGALNDGDGKLHRSVARARERLHFVACEYRK